MERLEKLIHRYDRNAMDHSPWLDQLAFRRIEQINQVTQLLPNPWTLMSAPTPRNPEPEPRGRAMRSAVSCISCTEFLLRFTPQIPVAFHAPNACCVSRPECLLRSRPECLLGELE
jgi:hypothetical protein